MKMPEAPPKTSKLLQQLIETDRLLTVMKLPPSFLRGSRYWHWDKLRHLKPPPGLSVQEWWFALKNYRRTQYNEVPLKDKNGRPFRFLLADPIPERLHHIDLGAGGLIQMPEQITNPETKDQYYVNSLMEEAITSSQLEGATTTRQVAKEMIRAGRPPRDTSERMILNNYLTMERIGKLKNEQLSKELVFQLHELVTQGTLDDPSAAGRFRRSNEPRVVGDDHGEVFHEPPPAEQLQERMEAMCAFANAKPLLPFIHPAIQSIILHFWLAYDHPFVDGNGRTARALFYWSMLHHGFWLFEFISISNIIVKGPSKYAQAFVYTETDENDLTYFILYHGDVIQRAISALHEYIERKTKQLRATEVALRGSMRFNHRQRALISHALRHPHHVYSIESHRRSHNVVYQTARTDLLDLARQEVLRSEKTGKTWYFTPARNLEERLAKTS